MKTEKTVNSWRFGLLLVLLCIWSLPQLAGAAALISQIPTGPKDINGNWATPDYYTTANWANSPPLAKFVDTLPGLTAANTNNLGQYLPLAVADTTTYPGSDYYIIELREYPKKLHSDLNPTKLRGYVQVDNSGAIIGAINYLGPVIVSERDRPVRIKFTNKLPAGSGGDLFIPVDTTVMGAGEGPLGPSAGNYTQNRADIHLHGGRTPWISDGTPHQWITPAAETSPYKKGVSLQNVPDMPDPGDGSTTYYFTNQQSARLMFYHDHAFGITRLNVYAGEAAGYLITDQHEKDLVTRGIIPADQIPLIIQDKTFVNADKAVHPANGGKVMTIRETDPLWNWGSGTVDANGIRQPVTGDLWMPHVYMPAQLPTGSAGGGVNPFGRWMYGPWFYPATSITHGPVSNPYYDPNCSSPDRFTYATCETPGQPPLIPGTPNVSMGMEAFQDSAVVNGTVFPSLTVDPRAYRFRILNAASDRFWNLSFYVADSDPAQLSPDTRLAPGNPDGLSNKTEVKMVPASAALAAANNWPPLWPTDGRDGGVPDPGVCAPGGLNCTNLGPKFFQIGNEAGFLPNPVTIVPQPITYNTDPTAFWVGNVDKMGLAVGPAERADVIVDFSAYAGKTLILYNDAPAAWPARVAGYDYYTNAPDLRDSGGYGTGGIFNPTTGVYEGGTGPLPGYAPNTRTVMQVIVRGSGSTNSYTQEKLEKEFTSAAPSGKTLFERAQEPIIVGQAAYKDAYPNSYFPTNFPWEGVNQMNDEFLQFFTLAGEKVKIPTEPKGIHDEMGASFDPEYGRMSGNLAMQLSNATTLNANLVLYGFSDIPTERVTNSTSLNIEVLPNASASLPGSATDGTQIWKISHNGVDTHPIHFHIFDVQLINRVGWDGQILLPEPNELGWKDTVKISPLEDTIVAVRPRAPALPFGIPNSLRPLNPAIPIDSAMNFTAPTAGSDWPFFRSIDWVTGEAYPADNPANPTNIPYPYFKGVVTNVLYDFGWEYVWHCHILSHEEMDMMRPIVLKVDTALPPAFTASAADNGASVALTWIDPTPVNYVTLAGSAADPETYRNPANEIGFNIYRSIDGGSSFSKLNTAALLANSTTYTVNSPVAGAIYQVEAFNAKGSTFSSSTNTLVVVAAANGTTFSSPGPITLSAAVSNIPAGVSISQVAFYSGATLLGTDANATAPNGFIGKVMPLGTNSTNSTNSTTATIWKDMPQGNYSITARVTDSQGSVTISAPITVTVNSTLVPNFTFSGSAAAADIGFCETITFTSTSAGATGYSWNINGVNYLTPTVNTTLPAGTYPVTLTVIDSATSATAMITKSVTVVNHAPTAIPGGPYTVIPGGSVTLNGSGTDTLDACNTAPLTYAWNVDNKGPNDYFTGNPTISYAVLNSVLGAGTHTMTLQVTDSNGGVGTATASVVVEILPAALTPISPTGSGIAITPTYTFSAIPRAYYYAISLWDNTLGTNVYSVYTPAQANCSSGTGNCTVPQATPLITGHNYSWFVLAQNGAGIGPWSSNTNFTVGVPPAPTPSSPAGIGIGVMPTYTFSAIFGVDYYAISLWDNTLGINVYSVYTPAQANCSSGTGNCTVPQATPLITGHNYSWFVLAQNGAGIGPWSSNTNFTVGVPTLPPAPTTSSPTGIGIGITPTYTFSAIPGVDYYAISLWDNTLGTNVYNAYTPAQANCSSGTGNCTVPQATSLISGHSYSWFVLAQNGVGIGPWSSNTNFTVGVPTLPPAPTTSSPTGIGIGITPTYTFSAILGVDYYAISLWDNTLGTNVYNAYTPAQANCSSGTGNCTVPQATPLISGHSYSWFVLAQNGVGIGPWSSNTNFTVQ